MLRERLLGAAFLFVMKKLGIFIVLLLLLIVSEYFFLNELFSQKRTYVILLSLLCSLVFIVFVIRFFKKYFLTIKQS